MSCIVYVPSQVMRLGVRRQPRKQSQLYEPGVLTHIW